MSVAPHSLACLTANPPPPNNWHLGKTPVVPLVFPALLRVAVAVVPLALQPGIAVPEPSPPFWGGIPPGHAAHLHVRQPNQTTPNKLVARPFSGWTPKTASVLLLVSLNQKGGYHKNDTPKWLPGICWKFQRQSPTEDKGGQRQASERSAGSGTWRASQATLLDPATAPATLSGLHRPCPVAGQPAAGCAFECPGAPNRAARHVAAAGAPAAAQATEVRIVSGCRDGRWQLGTPSEQHAPESDACAL